MAAQINYPRANNTVNTLEVEVSAAYDTTRPFRDAPQELDAPAATTYHLTIGISGPDSKSEVFDNLTGADSKVSKFTVSTAGDYKVYCDLTKKTSSGSSNYGQDDQSPIHVGSSGKGGLGGARTISPLLDAPPAPKTQTAQAGVVGADDDLVEALKEAAARGIEEAVASGLRPVVLRARLQEPEPGKPRSGLYVEIYHVEQICKDKTIDVVDYAAIPTVFGDEVTAVFPAAARTGDRFYRFTFTLPMERPKVYPGGPVR